MMCFCHGCKNYHDFDEDCLPFNHDGHKQHQIDRIEQDKILQRNQSNDGSKS